MKSAEIEVSSAAGGRAMGLPWRSRPGVALSMRVEPQTVYGWQATRQNMRHFDLVACTNDVITSDVRSGPLFI